MKTTHESGAHRLRCKIDTLTDRFLNGREPDFLIRHTRELDDYFRQTYETSMVGPRLGIEKNPFAIIALGGYGREEQCIHSDVDLLFLFGSSVPAQAEHLIREIVYPLWDIGLDVGYATRSLRECLALSAGDFEILTPLLDARFICGMSPLYSELMDQLHGNVIKRRARNIIEWLVESNRRRHVRFGDSAYLLEPNLKEGQGGLRDYHTMLWIGRIEVQMKHRRDFEYDGWMSHDEYAALEQALTFIWNVRNHLHSLCRRKCDQLHFENQLRLADVFRFNRSNGQQPVEKFLGKLHGQMEFLKQQHLIFLHEHGLEKKRRRRRRSKKTTPVAGLEVVKWGILNFSGPEAILSTPLLLLQIFEESARLKIPLSAEAKRLVKEFSYLIDKRLRNQPAVVASFEKTMVSPAPTFNVLNEMLQTGLLQRLIPDFRHIVNRIQYDAYHLYPVDKHSLRTVRTLKNFGSSRAVETEPLCHQIYRELKNRKLLLWAALLHDIGKGLEGKHHARRGAEIARRLMTEKGLTPGDVDTVAFLVREHLLLIETATRRDIHDEETAVACARRIKTIGRLKMLYLLTAADSMSTGPIAWNDWTSNLLREFFLKVHNVLEKGELATEKAVVAVLEKKNQIMAAARNSAENGEFEKLYGLLSPRYLLFMPVSDMLEHFRLYRELGDAPFVWKIEASDDLQTRTVTLCAHDRPGLISNIAGVLTLTSVNILDVQVFTWRNGIALDIFKVTPPPDRLFEEEKWDRAAGQLTEALLDGLDLTRLLDTKRPPLARSATPGLKKPHVITVDNETSSFFTIIEIITYDFSGLLYRIADALFRCGLSIWVAKIATKVDQVVDVFYVRDINGQKVDDPEQVDIIRQSVLKRLPDPDGPVAGE